MSPARVRVALTPPAPGMISASACAVAVDVLRATTTLAFARAHGAARIEPYASTDEALAARARGALACGERDGRIVQGFDLGNSPAEYTPERIAGRTLAFASTNGSRALLAAQRCRRRLIASFVNRSATLEALAREPEIVIVCAGKLGTFALEDTALAGTLAAALAAKGAMLEGPGARLAATFACRDAADARAVVTGSDHGRWLMSLGDAFAEDVRMCSQVDTLPEACEW